MSDLLYTVFTMIEPEVEEEFTRWQNEIHCPALMTLPGYHYVTRYSSLDREHYHTNFWHISSQADFDNPDRAVKARDPLGVSMDAARHRHIDFYIQNGGLEMDPPVGEQSDQLSYMILDQYTDVYDLRNQVGDTYRRELPALRQIPGVLDAVMYHSYEGKGTAENYLAVYCSVKSEEELNSICDELCKRVGYPLPGRFRERFRFTGIWYPEKKLKAPES